MILAKTPGNPYTTSTHPKGSRSTGTATTEGQQSRAPGALGDPQGSTRRTQGEAFCPIQPNGRPVNHIHRTLGPSVNHHVQLTSIHVLHLVHVAQILLDHSNSFLHHYLLLATDAGRAGQRRGQ